MCYHHYKKHYGAFPHMLAPLPAQSIARSRSQPKKRRRPAGHHDAVPVPSSYYYKHARRRAHCPQCLPGATALLLPGRRRQPFARQRRLMRGQRRRRLRAHHLRHPVQAARGGRLRVREQPRLRAVALRCEVAPGRRVVPVRPLPAPAGEPHRRVAQEAAPPRVPRRRAPARRRRQRRQERRHHVRLPAPAAPGGEHGGRGRGAARGPRGPRGAAAGPGLPGRRDDPGVRRAGARRAGPVRAVAADAAGRAARAPPRARVPAGGRQGRRRRRGRGQGGQARGRVPGGGRAGGRPPAGRVRGAGPRGAGARPRGRRRPVPRRRHLPQGTPVRDQGGAAVAVPADRRAQAVGGGGRARRAERPPAGALRGAGALPVVGARRPQAHRPPPPHRVERRGRFLPRPATDQEPRRRFPRPPLRRCRRRQWQRAVPVQARGRRRAAPRAAAPPRGRRAPPGAVPHAAGAGGPAGLGERPAAAGAVQVGRRVPIRRRPGRRRDVEGGRLRQRRGQDAAQRGEAGAGHADGVKVAQVSLLKPTSSTYPSFF